MEQLQGLILSSVPRTFFERLASRHPVLNEEAREMAYSAPWTRQEAEAAIPTNRRGLFEHEFRLSAKDCELEPINLKHPGESNYWYVMVRAKKLWLTCHHVDRPNRFVRPALARKQNAAVNELIDETFFEELLQEVPPKLGDGDRTYAQIIHGLTVEERDGQKFPKLFMQVAFPHADVERYVRVYDVLDLLQLYAAHEQPIPGTPGALVDNAKPTLNVKPAETEEKTAKQGG